MATANTDTFLSFPIRFMGNASQTRLVTAPRENGGKLISPASDAVPQLVRNNRAQLQSCSYDLHGVSLAQLALQARRELVSQAARYTSAYRDIPADVGQALDPSSRDIPRLFLAGHQPELFHPGVWLKNFVLDRLARRHDALSVNLVVDSDTIKRSSVRVPTGTAAQPLIESVLFDQSSAPLPFEQRAIIDRALFNSFGERAARTIAPLVARPMVESFWSLAVARSRETANLGECLSQARHAWEGRWGGSTLEIPQSQVCGLPSFLHFTAHLLAHLPRLWDVYNSALIEYRNQHGIRSAAHPVPQLATQDDWLEAPLWLYRDSDPIRRRVFARSRNDVVTLSDRAGWQIELNLSAEGDLDRAMSQLASLASQGVRLRTRALVTTMVARVLLGDLFVHGIGGAKYDELTDQLIERFFGLTAPAYLTVSGTLQLPIARARARLDDTHRMQQQLRELTFHPEQFVRANDANGESSVTNGIDGAAAADPSAAQAWIDQKRRWIETPATIQNARERCRAIRQANQQLQPWVGTQRADLELRTAAAEQSSRVEALLSSREYSFCLYGEDELRKFLTQ